MDEYMIGLRILHFLSGIFWVGVTLFVFFFLEPAISKSGPAGSQVMGTLARSKMPITMMSASTLTIVSGFLLYMRVSGFNTQWISSGTGLAFTIGGIAGFLAFLEGLVVHMPLQLKMKSLGEQIQAAGGQSSPEQMKQSESLQRKLRHAAMWSMVLLVIAVLGMAAARYIF